MKPEAGATVGDVLPTEFPKGPTLGLSDGKALSKCVCSDGTLDPSASLAMYLSTTCDCEVTV